MKKQIKNIVLIIALMMFAKITNGQWLPAAGVPPSLFTQPIYPGFPNDILSVGIGDFNTPGLSTNSFLHINSNLIPSLPANGSIASFGEVFRTDAPDRGIYSFWRMSTGIPSVEHLGIYNSDSWILNPNYRYLDMNFRSSSGNMFFWTQGNHDNGVKRMMINSDVPANLNINGVTSFNTPGWNTNGYVGIGFNNPAGVAGGFGIWDIDQPGATGPRSLLHLEGPNNTNFGGNGWRSWMRTGTYTKENSDEMYVGMKNEFNTNGKNRSDAVIMWGDDQFGFDAPQADNFKIVFSAASNGFGNGLTNPFNPFTFAGLEVMRITPLGRMGVGPTFTFANGPARRLELLDYKNPNINGNPSVNEPQLRLTFTQANPSLLLTTGVWTDFQTTALGNMRINPSNQRAGINLGTVLGTNLEPQNTLEIDANPAYNNSYVGTNLSGLRFNDMASSSPVAAIGTYDPSKFLTLEADGDVVLGDIRPCSPNPTDLNVIPKWNNLSPVQLCRSDIYNDNFNHISLNVSYIPTAPLLAYSLSNNGSAMFFQEASTLYPFGGYIKNSADAYPLAVKTTFHAGSASYNGLAIYSSQGTGTVQDRMNIYSDNNGNNVFASYASNNSQTYFHDQFYNVDGFGFMPQERSTVFKDDFSTTLTYPLTGGGRSRVYAEAIFDATHGQAQWNAVWGNNLTVLPAGNTADFIGIKGTSTGGNLNYRNIGGDFFASNAYSKSCGINALSIANTANLIVNYGGKFEGSYQSSSISTSGVDNYGIYAQAGNTVTVGTNHNNYGVYGVAYNASNAGYNNYGGYFTADNSSNLTYGMYAFCQPLAGATCTTGTCVRAAGFFNGDIAHTGGIFLVSDTIFKNNITPLSITESQMDSINSYSYTYKTSSFPNVGLQSGTHYGFTAQEVEAVFPSMVRTFKAPATTDSSGNIIDPEVTFKAVDYVEFIPMLWNQNKTLKQIVDTLTNRITAIEQTVASCCNSRTSNPNPSTTTGSIELENLKSIQLEQNDPNPFVENSIIRWSIPTGFKEATILFFENSGSQINKYKIEQKGNGELQVFGSKLSSGVYTYTLVVDGKIIDSKKMMKAK